MIKNEFKKGDLIEIRKDLVGGVGNIPAGTMGFVIGFHSFQKAPYNLAWYNVHLADGRTKMMLDGWLTKVNNG